MPLLNVFFFLIAQKKANEKHSKIIPSGQEISTIDPNSLKNCHQRKKLRIKCDKVNEVYQAFALTAVGRKCRVQ